MADLRIVDAPLLSTVKGTEKLPTGGEGNFSVSVNQVADFTKLKWFLATEEYVDNAVGNVQADLNLHKNNELNPHNVTKTQVGLDAVDNTADLDKPLSNANIAALSLKADKTYVDNQLTLKANKADVDNQLTLKANKADVDNQLTLKANKADVYTKSETYTKQESSDLVNNSLSSALTPVNSSLDLAKRGIANRYDPLLIYNSGERVVLTNGDIVKSTIDGNANDPNADMTGWVKTNDATQIFNGINPVATYLRYITPSVFGIIDSTSLDQAVKLQSMVYFATNNGLTIIGERITCCVKSQIIIPPTLFANWNGFKIKYLSGFSGGTGSLVSLEKGSSTAPWLRGAPLDYLVIEGSAGNNPDESLVLDGLYIGSAAMQTSDMSFSNLRISGFRDCLNFKGQSTYLLNFINVKIGVAWRTGIIYSASVDSGENIQFFGGSVYNCVNSTKTAVGIKNTPESSTLDIFLNGLSLDYNDISSEMNHSKFTFTNCHFENNNNNPHIKMNSTGGKARTVLIMRGGNLGGGPNGSAPFEDSDGRPCYIELFGNSMTIDIDATECGGFRVAGQKTEIVKNTGGQNQRRVRIRPLLDASRETSSSVPCSITNMQNALYVATNGGVDGWTQAGGWSADTTVKASYDTGSRKLSTTSTSGSLTQEIPCSAGNTIVVKVWSKTAGLTQGFVAIRLQFINAAGIVINDDTSPRQADKDTSTIKEISTLVQAPSGTVKVRVILTTSGMQAEGVKEVWFSGERTWIY